MGISSSTLSSVVHLPPRKTCHRFSPTHAYHDYYDKDKKAQQTSAFSIDGRAWVGLGPEARPEEDTQASKLDYNVIRPSNPPSMLFLPFFCCCGLFRVFMYVAA